MTIMTVARGRWWLGPLPLFFLIYKVRKKSVGANLVFALLPAAKRANTRFAPTAFRGSVMTDMIDMVSAPQPQKPRSQQNRCDNA